MSTSWMPRRTTVTTPVRCDSCTVIIPTGVTCRRIPVKTQRKARSRTAAMIASRGGGKTQYTYRCVGCPIPELSIRCPTCERLPHWPCALPVRDRLGKIIDHGRDMRRPHQARTRAVTKRNRALA
jgi:hypothetical protein